MRTLLIAALLGFAGPALAQDLDIGPGGVEISPYGHHRRHDRDRGDCRELRAACMHKEELGEEGQGNCQRYRELCRR
jgi:hypothetical protein